MWKKRNPFLEERIWKKNSKNTNFSKNGQKTDKKRRQKFFFKFLKISKNVKTGKKTEKKRISYSILRFLSKIRKKKSKKQHHIDWAVAKTLC